MEIVYLIIAFLSMVLILNLKKALNINSKEKTKKKSKPKKDTAISCYNGICKTIDELEKEIDEFDEKYPKSRQIQRIRRRLKAL